MNETIFESTKYKFYQSYINLIDKNINTNLDENQDKNINTNINKKKNKKINKKNNFLFFLL